MPHRLRNSLIQKKEQIRKEKMLAYISKEQIGLEIGPSFRPCASKKDGYHVEIVDCQDQKGLIEKYSLMGIDTSKIEEVDYIWNGGRYTEVTGKIAYYDYIIASHVIEHVPDFIGFLKDCSEMLKPDGILSIAVPDKRFTLDHFRMVTNTCKVINDYLSEDKYDSMGALTDYWNHVVRRVGLTSWEKARDLFLKKDYEFIHDENFNQKAFWESLACKMHGDFHQNVFTPASFELLIYELLEYGLIDMKIESLYHMHTDEFLVSMKKCSVRPVLSSRERMDLMRRVSRENVIR